MSKDKVGEKAKVDNHPASWVTRGTQPRRHLSNRLMSSASPQQQIQMILRNPTTPLPHIAALQRSFGRHRLDNIRTLIGGAAGVLARDLDASAFTYGDFIGFERYPSLELAAHETAHVVQQRAGVSPGPPTEEMADAVAERVRDERNVRDLLPPIGVGSPLKNFMLQRKDNRYKRRWRAKNNRKEAAKDVERKLAKKAERRKKQGPPRKSVTSQRKNTPRTYEKGRRVESSEKKVKKPTFRGGVIQKRRVIWGKPSGSIEQSAETEARKLQGETSVAMQIDFIPALAKWEKEANSFLKSECLDPLLEWLRSITGLDEKLEGKLEVKLEAKVGPEFKGAGVHTGPGLTADNVGKLGVKVTGRLGYTFFKVRLSELLSGSGDGRKKDPSKPAPIPTWRLPGLGEDVTASFDATARIAVEIGAEAGAELSIKPGMISKLKDALSGLTRSLGKKAAAAPSLAAANLDPKKGAPRKESKVEKSALSFLEGGFNVKFAIEALAEANGVGLLNWNKRPTPAHYVDSLLGIPPLLALTGNPVFLTLGPLLEAIQEQHPRALETAAEYLFIKNPLAPEGKQASQVIKVDITPKFTAGVGGSYGYKFVWSANGVYAELAQGLTWGLGIHLKCTAEINPIETLRLAAVLLGRAANVLSDILPHATDYAWKIFGKLRDLIADAVGSLLDWWAADDRAIELVQLGGHRTLDAKGRAELVRSILDWVVVGESEEAVLEVLRFSQVEAQDLAEVLINVGEKLPQLHMDVDGAEGRELAKMVNLPGYCFYTRVAEGLRYPVFTFAEGHRVVVLFTDDSDGRYNAKVSRDEGKAQRGIGGEPENKSAVSFFLSSPPVHVRAVGQQGGEESAILAGFPRLAAAVDSRIGGHGVWLEKVKE